MPNMKTKKETTSETPAVKAEGINLKNVAAVAVKIPAWFKRVQTELKKLIENLTKLDMMIDHLSALVEAKTASKKDKDNLKMLMKQRKAMAAYKDALEARVSYGF